MQVGLQFEDISTAYLSGALFLKVNQFLLLCIGYLKVRAGVEMALIDAASKSIGVPLWRLFGGASNTITTDITVEFLFE